MRTIKFITWDEGTDGIAVEFDGRQVWADGAHDSWDQFFRHVMPRGEPVLLEQDTRPSEREQDDRPYPVGRSTGARLARWLVDSGTDSRIRDIEYDDDDHPVTSAVEVTLSSSDLFDLVSAVAERFYFHGADDVRESGLR